MVKPPKPLALIILDGWGHREEKKDNGIALAKTPYFDFLQQNYPHTLIDGSGPAVGLPAGVMGNSEVGHMNLGAGRIVYSGLSQIYRAIEDKSFFLNPALLEAFRHVVGAKPCFRPHVGAGLPRPGRGGRDPTLHLMGLLSDGAVHSHQDHLYALLKLAKQNGVRHVAIHCFLDGRDTSPNDGVKFIRMLQEKICKVGVGRIASLMGRYFAMDRDQNWDRIEKAFWAICGKSQNHFSDPISCLEKNYAAGVGDEFIEPVLIEKTLMTENDAVIFFNFRADRARQISQALTDKKFSLFDRKDQALPGIFVCMSPYEKNIEALVAFQPDYPKKIFPELLSEKKFKQLRIAETEKYAHVTFFFNGGIDQPFENEDRVLIPSPKDVATYDQRPEMSAFHVKDELVKRIRNQVYDVIICNFANADMVGHTAQPDAIVKAVETIDACLSEIIPEILNAGGVAIITADHGNAELMCDKNGGPMTAHTTNLVPFVLVSEKHKGVKLKNSGRLCDVAPTMLEILEIKKPKEMTGTSLLPRDF